MEETIFEYMERVRLVDHVLMAAALLLPALIAAAVAVPRLRPVVLRHPHRWAMGAIAGPAILILWKTYNAVMDRCGLDSIRGLAINACIFLLAGVLMSFLYQCLYLLCARHQPREAGRTTRPPNG